eukprot:3146117-Amphidinium_carterae.1
MKTGAGPPSSAPVVKFKAVCASWANWAGCQGKCRLIWDGKISRPSRACWLQMGLRSSGLLFRALRSRQV